MALVRWLPASAALLLGSRVGFRHKSRRDENNRDYIRWCFADEPKASEFAREFGSLI
jgi:hypothetical protein